MATVVSSGYVWQVLSANGNPMGQWTSELDTADFLTKLNEDADDVTVWVRSWQLLLKGGGQLEVQTGGWERVAHHRTVVFK